jgi:hypothetical protein
VTRRKKRPVPRRRYSSGLEKKVCDDLDRRGIDYKYESEVLIYIEPARTRKYTPDVILGNGIIVEIKGRWMLDDRKKMALVIEQNPDLDIRMLFQQDKPINKGSKTSYTDWCNKRGILCAVGNKVPDKWLKKGSRRK